MDCELNKDVDRSHTHKNEAESSANTNYPEQRGHGSENDYVYSNSTPEDLTST